MPRFAYTLLLAGCLALGALGAHAGEFMLTWKYDKPAPIDGFRIYTGSTSRAGTAEPKGEALPYDEVVQIDDKAARSWRFNVEAPACMFLRMTTFGKSASGKVIESVFSEEIMAISRPGAPVDLIIER